MKDLLKILTYFAGVIFLGILLAPPLYWGGQSLASRGIMEFLAETKFQKFFNRAMLIAAVLLLWPVVKWLRIGSVRELGLQPDPLWRRHLLIGFFVAGFSVAVMAGAYIGFDLYHWKKTLPWGAVPKLLLSALVVAILEECLFRGALLGLFRRTASRYAALFWVSALFAIVHFLKPDDKVIGGSVNWLSGFDLLPGIFHQFGDPLTLLAGFPTLFVLGWVLGYAALRTRALWMSIGLHAGIVFVKMTFSKFSKRDDLLLPWVGPELQIGLVPVAMLSLCGLFTWWVLKNETAPVTAANRDTP